jgi:hypothetical protein
MAKTPFLVEWNVTPSRSIEFIIQEQLMAINPGIKACCFWHASLRQVASVVYEMLLRQCDKQFQPTVRWQCTACGCLQFASSSENDSDDDQDPDEQRICQVCEEERPDSNQGGDMSDPADLDSNLADQSKSEAEVQAESDSDFTPRCMPQNASASE